MQQDNFLVPVTEKGRKVLDLMKADPKQASQLMQTLSSEEQVSLVSHQALGDPLAAQELLFLLKDEESAKIVEGLGDRTLFRIMKSQTSSHIGVLSLVDPQRMQSILDLDQELFSKQGATDPETAYHWIVSLLEEEEPDFAVLLRNVDIRVIASAFQDKIKPPAAYGADEPEEEEQPAFPAGFMEKLDRGELKPDDLTVTEEAALDVLTRIHLVDEMYFNALVSLMIREDDLKSRTAEAAMDRIHSQVGDMTELTEEAEDMFVPLEE